MFDSAFFASPRELALGTITGLIFGFLLQKGAVTRYRVILGQFLLTDFTVAKVMGTAIVTGAIGIYAMLALGVIESADMHLKSATVWGNLIGGVVFGVGMAILGYCPGTGVGAIADGSRHAIFGVLGMLAGAALYAEVHTWVNEKLLKVNDLGKVTLSQESGLSPWWLIIAMAIVAAVGFGALERWERRRAAN
ncbi:MAG: DUF6691 family protein [Phycisphaerales bacterium]